MQTAGLSCAITAPRGHQAAANVFPVATPSPPQTSHVTVYGRTFI